jgi:hypothetical protein
MADAMAFWEELLEGGNACLVDCHEPASRMHGEMHEAEPLIVKPEGEKAARKGPDHTRLSCAGEAWNCFWWQPAESHRSQMRR